MPTIRLLLTAIAAATLLLAVACDSSDDEPTAEPTASISGGGGASTAMGPGISIADALASTLDGPLLVNGFLVATAEEVRFCDLLAESYPPQCGGDYLLVEGLDLGTIEGVQEASGVSWTDQPIQLLGTVEDGVLTIDGLSMG